jgi:hypothetical protein
VHYFETVRTCRYDKPTQVGEKMSRSKITLLVLFLSTTLPWSGEGFSNPSSTAGRTYGSTGSSFSNTSPSTRSLSSSSKRQQALAPFGHASITHHTSKITSPVILKESLTEGEKKRRSRQLLATSGDTNNKNIGKRWHKRLFSKFWHRSDASTAVTPLRMTVMDDETAALLESITVYNNEEFIFRNFDVLNPKEVLAGFVPSDDLMFQDAMKIDTIKSQTSVASANTMIDSEFYDVAICPADVPSKNASEIKTKRQRSVRRISLSLARLMAALIENILTSRVVNSALEVPENFVVQVEPLGNSVRRLLLKGQLRANAKISTGRLVFAPIRFSKGSLELEGVTLNLFGFLQQQQPQQEQSENLEITMNKNSLRDDVVRYPKQFDIHVKDLTMSRHDLLFSPCVKNGLRELLINILKDRGVQSSSIRITSIDILVGSCVCWYCFA